jgi:N-acetylglucosaminylphosphatidylinositol deacetylase
MIVYNTDSKMNTIDQVHRSFEHDNVLLVLAHPDDESMFFAPTLLNLLAHKINVFVLCLSDGNDKGLGNIRRNELYVCCDAYGITSARIMISDFVDGPNNEWNIEDIVQVINIAVKRWNVTTLLTFDEKGVSGHLNHITTYYAVKHYLDYVQQLPAYKLISVKPKEQYLYLFNQSDKPVNDIDSITFRSNAMSKTWNKMSKHSSQFTWYRKLSVIFSRYTYVNTLKVI